MSPRKKAGRPLGVKAPKGRGRTTHPTIPGAGYDDYRNVNKDALYMIVSSLQRIADTESYTDRTRFLAREEARLAGKFLAFACLDDQVRLRMRRAERTPWHETYEPGDERAFTTEEEKTDAIRTGPTQDQA